MKFQMTSILSLLVLTGCVHSADPSRKDGEYFNSKFDTGRLECTDSSYDMTTQIYFGLSKPDGGNVTSSEWNEFLSNTLIPEFGGMTIISGSGAWEDDQGAIATENNKVIIWHHKNTVENAKKIANVTEKYIDDFEQYSVLLNSYPSGSRFCKVVTN